LWDGKRWAADPDAVKVVALARETVESLLTQALAPDSKDREALLKYYFVSARRERIRAMIDLARHQMLIEPGKFLADPFALNCTNGTIDLRTGKLRAHNPDDLITKLAPVDYDPKAKAPRFDRFMLDIMKSAERVNFMRRALGYSATGKVNEQCIFISQGDGSNGKGTLMGLMRKCLGEYAITARSELLVKSDQNKLADNAELNGKRLAVVQETADNHRLDEAQVKKLTGGDGGADTLKGKRLYQNQFDFTPTHTIWLCTNHEPIIRGTDDGIWRRIKLIPMVMHYLTEREYADRIKKKQISRDDPNYDILDNTLIDKLDVELKGILAWVVRGSKEWWNNGKPDLREPRSITNATARYKSEMDILQGFISAECVKDPSAETPHGTLYIKFASYLTSLGLRVWSSKSFGRALGNAGYKANKKKHGAPRMGIKLRPLAFSK